MDMRAEKSQTKRDIYAQRSEFRALVKSLSDYVEFEQFVAEIRDVLGIDKNLDDMTEEESMAYANMAVMSVRARDAGYAD